MKIGFNTGKKNRLTDDRMKVHKIERQQERERETETKQHTEIKRERYKEREREIKRERERNKERRLQLFPIQSLQVTLTLGLAIMWGGFFSPVETEADFFA